MCTLDFLKLTNIVVLNLQKKGGKKPHINITFDCPKYDNFFFHYYKLNKLNVCATCKPSPSCNKYIFININNN